MDEWLEELRREFRRRVEEILGSVPREAEREFEEEVKALRGLTLEEAREAVRRLAEEVVRELAMRRGLEPIKVFTGVEATRLPVPTAPPEERPVRVELPSRPLEPMKFPRRLASSEIKAFWEAFRRRVKAMGFDPEDEAVMAHFIAFRDAWFSSWEDVLRAFEQMIEDVREGRPPRLYPRPLVPMPWKDIPRDPVLHILATKIADSLEELVLILLKYGISVTADEAREIVRREWCKPPKERDPWLKVVTKEYICKIFGFKPEELPD